MIAGHRKPKEHLALVASLPCAACGRQPVQAHHLLRTPDHEHGTGKRSGDNWTIPLCGECHTTLHRDGNETRWLAARVIDGPALAATLWAAKDYEEAANIIGTSWLNASFAR